jgi:hypothetical protein
MLVSLLKAHDDLYRFVFIAGSIVFVAAYGKYSSFKLMESLKSGWALGLILSIFIGLGFVSISLTGSQSLSAAIKHLNVPIIAWRGIAFGIVSGIMISTFPFVVVWRSLAGHNPGVFRKAIVTVIAAFSIALISLLHNFALTGIPQGDLNARVQKSVIVGLPTLLSGNPIAAPISGAFLSVSEVLKVRNDQPLTPDRQTIIADKPSQTGGSN